MKIAMPQHYYNEISWFAALALLLIKSRTVLIILPTIVLSFNAAAADLNGVQVTTGVYCCVAPLPSNLVSNLAVRTVGPGVELPTGALNGGIIPISIDFTATTIDTVFTGAANAANGTFNGYLFQFVLPADNFISSVSLNALSNYTPVSVSFTANTVAINNAGLNFSVGSRAVLNVVVSVAPIFADGFE